MIIRVPETHVCPEATKEAKVTPFTAEIRSASLKTTIGACRRHIKKAFAFLRILPKNHLAT
jgi:hypothetical protein